MPKIRRSHKHLIPQELEEALQPDPQSNFDIIKFLREFYFTTQLIQILKKKKYVNTLYILYYVYKLLATDAEVFNDQKQKKKVSSGRTVLQNTT